MQGAGSNPSQGGRFFWDLCSNLGEGRSSISGGGKAERVGWLTIIGRAHAAPAGGAVVTVVTCIWGDRRCDQ
jgi:hypothetical protein